MDNHGRLSVQETSEDLNLSTKAITHMCKEGMLDACPDTELSGMSKIPKKGDDYWIEPSEIETFRQEGPRPRFGFEEAMKRLKEGKFVRRAAWPMNGLRYDEMAKSMTNGVSICYFYVFRAASHDRMDAYEPTKEDREATDWVEYTLHY